MGFSFAFSQVHYKIKRNCDVIKNNYILLMIKNSMQEKNEKNCDINTFAATKIYISILRSRTKTKAVYLSYSIVAPERHRHGR